MLTAEQEPGWESDTNDPDLRAVHGLAHGTSVGSGLKLKHALKPSWVELGSDTLELCPLGFAITTATPVERSAPAAFTMDWLKVVMPKSANGA